MRAECAFSEILRLEPESAMQVRSQALTSSLYTVMVFYTLVFISDTFLLRMELREILNQESTEIDKL